MAEDILQELAWRGAINQTTDEDGLRDQMTKEQIGVRSEEHTSELQSLV